MSANSRGAVYVAYGAKAHAEAEQSIATLKKYNDIPVTVIRRDFAEFPDMTNGQRSRWAKLSLLELSPYDHTVYLDADTRISANLRIGFDILDDGFDLVMCASEQQGDNALWHVGNLERQNTFAQLGYLPLQLQAGVMFVRKSENMIKLFERWCDEWRFYCDQDQAALLRALDACQVKIWLLGRAWNGSGGHGTVVRHNFGRCRE